MTDSIFILGRQPILGRAELESLYGASTLKPLGERAILCSLPSEQVDFGRLGGSVKLASHIKTLDTDKWPEIARQIADYLPDLIKDMPTEGKTRLGLSVFGNSVGVKQLFATGLELKKVFKKAGRSVRLVPNTEPELSSAQVLHNQLTGDLGIELLIIQNGRQTVLARTLAVQDINAYARRDQGRPKRDARVGMLPPKLAQIIVNLAIDKLTADSKQLTVLDPFCGTGVILQEALLMGYDVYGTDVGPRMIDYARQNLDWLSKNYKLKTIDYRLTEADATDNTWAPSPNLIAGEAYLGRPFSAPPKPEILAEVMQDVDTILTKFLQNVARQTKPDFRMCIAVPAWRLFEHPNSNNVEIRHLPLIDHLGKLGYNRVSFEHAKTDELVYYRPDQIVARELLVITRN